MPAKLQVPLQSLIFSASERFQPFFNCGFEIQRSVSLQPAGMGRARCSHPAFGHFWKTPKVHDPLGQITLKKSPSYTSPPWWIAAGGLATISHSVNVAACPQK